MEYKSNNGVYALAPQSLLSSLRHILRLHGRQVLLPQFNNRPHATFMTIIIPLFWEAKLPVCCDVVLYPFLSTHCLRPLFDNM